MFDKLLGKKEKGIQVFSIPQKKYCHDSKKLSKMDKKDLADVVSDMEKYVSNLCDKLQLGKKQFERSQERCQEISQKSNVLNGEMARINNEHEELQVKFTNLQNSLEIMITERESLLKQTTTFIEDKQLSKDKIKELANVIELYHCNIETGQKISTQNRQLKQRCQSIQQEYHCLSSKFNDVLLKLSQKSEKQLKIECEYSKQSTSESDDQPLFFCNECSKWESILSGKEQLLVSLNKQIQSVKQENVEQVSQIEELNKNLESALLNVGQSESRINEQFKQIESLNKNMSILKKKNEQLTQVQSSLKSQNENLKQKISQQQVQLNQWKEKQKSTEIQNQRIMNEMSEQSKMFETKQRQIEKECSSLKVEVQQKQMQFENINVKLQTYEAEIQNMSKFGSEIKSKEKLLQEIQKDNERIKQKNDQLKDSMKRLEEEHQIKLKKLEFSSNQQRIKTDGLKRSLSNLQTNTEQQKKSLDKMYETKMQQDGKVAQMEKKLKQYKHLIQYLRKQKIELEQTFEKKIRNMEEMVINEVDEDDQPNQVCSSPQTKMISPREEAQKDFQIELIGYQNQIANFQQQMDFLKEENMKLKQQKNEILEENDKLKRNIKSLTEKREEVLRQIRRMTSLTNVQTTNSVQNQKLSLQQIKIKERRVAQKAYKGFDILAKLLSALYKQFIALHVKDIQKKEVKLIESSINSIVKKSLDMKDIFQDYF